MKGLHTWVSVYLQLASATKRDAASRYPVMRSSRFERCDGITGGFSAYTDDELQRSVLTWVGYHCSGTAEDDIRHTLVSLSQS